MNNLDPKPEPNVQKNIFFDHLSISEGSWSKTVMDYVKPREQKIRRDRVERLLVIVSFCCVAEKSAK